MEKIRICAKEVPACHTYPVCLEDSINNHVNEGVLNLWGNRYFNSHTSDLFDEIRDIADCDNMDILDVLDSFDDPEDDDCLYKSHREIVEDLFPMQRVGNLSDDDIEEICKLVQDDTLNQDAIRYKTCALMYYATGKQWDVTCIWGSSQSDWQWMYYTVKDWNQNCIDTFACEYFNTGKAWLCTLYDGISVPDDDNCEEVPVYIYTHYCMNDMIREEIATYFNHATGEDVDLYTIKNERTVYEYEREVR